MPLTRDLENYESAYHSDPVASFTANALPNHTVDFHWDEDNIHNERAFLINWRNNCTGQWQPLYAAAKNTSSKTLSGLQGGEQEFQILPLTNAGPGTSFAGDPVNLPEPVEVVPSLGLNPPSGLASTFPSTSINRLAWPEVPAADHYKIRYDLAPTGVVAPGCLGDDPDPQEWIYETQYDHILPVLAYRPIYYRVMACDAANVCSPLSDSFTFSDRFDAGVWEYVYTFSRSVNDIVLQFINFNPSQTALQLHILNGDEPDDPVADSDCILPDETSFVGPLPYTSFSSGMLATRGHGVYSAIQCASTHDDDSPTVRSGAVPTVGGPVDTDGDGCRDAKEIQSAPGSETAGGLRDPFNPYDFYDVDGDTQVSLTTDILPVLVRWTPNPQQPYDAIYDRGAQIGPNPWNRAGPDGQISLTFDILGVILQWLHNCN